MNRGNTRGVLLDSRTGKPQGVARDPEQVRRELELIEEAKERWPLGERKVLGAWFDDEGFAMAPPHIRESLERGRELGQGGPRATGWSAQELIGYTLVDGTTLTAAAEALLVPDFILLPNYCYAKRTLRYTLSGRQSSPVTTPGTFTWRFRWGGLAGVLLAASAAMRPKTTVSTNLTWQVCIDIVTRTEGVTGTMMAIGTILMGSSIGDAASFGEQLIPTSAPVVATVDTTIQKALSATMQPSLATGSVTCHTALLESLN
jgi:hypothetical protein